MTERMPDKWECENQQGLRQIISVITPQFDHREIKGFACVSLFRKRQEPCVRLLEAPPPRQHPGYAGQARRLRRLAAPGLRCRPGPVLQVLWPGAWDCCVVQQMTTLMTATGQQRTPFPHAEGDGLASGKACAALAPLRLRQS